MAGLRDILIHEYFGIDLVNVWNISRVSIHGTLAEIKKLPEYIAAAKLLAEEME